MGKLLVALLIFCASVVAAAPHIDSIRVDEAHKQLQVFGSFGTGPYIIFCDGLTLSSISQTPTLLIASLPDSGKGSAGPVQVIADGIASNTKLLSTWDIDGSYFNRGGDGVTYSVEGGSGYRFIVRFDLEAILNRAIDSPVSIMPTSLSYVTVHYADKQPSSTPNGYTTTTADATVPIIERDTQYTIGAQCLGSFDPKALSFHFRIIAVRGVRKITNNYNHFDTTDYPVGDFIEDVTLDSLFHIQKIAINNNHGWPEEIISQQGTATFLPNARIYTRYRPQLLSPVNGATAIGTEDEVLSWKPIPYIDSFRVQLATDSLFTSIELDTIVADTAILLRGLQQKRLYYWHTAAHIPEYDGRWSEIWTFTTADRAEVGSWTAERTYLQITPSVIHSSVAHLRYSSLEGEISITIANEAGAIVLHSIQKRINAGIDWDLDVSSLSNGYYRVLVTKGDMLISAPLIISR